MFKRRRKRVAVERYQVSRGQVGWIRAFLEAATYYLIRPRPMILKILVIDDEPEIVRQVESWLAEKPYKVIGANDGKTGLEAVAREHPDLILLDIMMPGMKGHEVLRALKLSAGTRGIPVIMLSQKLGTSSILDAQDYGASDYLTKPFLPEELLKTIRMYA